jgi:transposase
MEVLYPYCAGLDVHKKTVVACRRLSGQPTEVRTFGTTTRELLLLSDWLSEGNVTHVVMESTGVYWRPVWHILSSNFECLLANPLHVRTVPGRKSDVNDAQWLAELLAHGLVAGSFVPPTPIQELRELTRTRKQLVRDIAQYTLRIQKVLEDTNIKLSSVVSDTLGVTGRNILKALISGETDPVELAELAQGRLKTKKTEIMEALNGKVTEHHRFLLQLHLGQVEALENAVITIETRLGECLEPFRESEELLTSIPGVSLTVARVILAEIGQDMSRFPTVGHLISWAGLCPQMHESAGKRKTTRVRKGAPWLKTTLVQSAWAASRKQDTYLQPRFHRLKVKRGPKKAAVAIAANILKAAYYVLSKRTPYEDLGVNYFDTLDKQKTVAKHVRKLESLGYSVSLQQAAA